MKLLKLFLILIVLVSCSPSKQSSEQVSVKNEDKSIQVEKYTAQPDDQLNKNEAKVETLEPTKSIFDYFPFQENVIKVFKGEGNEFASFTSSVQYLEDNRIQYVMKYGGTQTVLVFEKKDNQINLVFQQSEVYYREKMLDRTGNIRTFLSGPVELGTKWLDFEKKEAEITGIDVDVEGYSCIEITSGLNKLYFGKGIGLVKVIYDYGSGDVITSTLEKVIKNEPVEVNYTIFAVKGDQVENIPITEKLKTNDIFRLALSKSLIKEKILPEGTTINSLVLNRTDNRVYLDISDHIYQNIRDLNQEKDLLQTLVRTIGGIYNTDQLYLWVNGMAYQGPHVKLSKNELLKIVP